MYYFWLGIDAEDFHEFDRMIAEDYDGDLEGYLEDKEMTRLGY